jgi:hypothetical protein
MPKQKRAKHAPLDIQMSRDETLEHSYPKKRGKGAAREQQREAKQVCDSVCCFCFCCFCLFVFVCT